MLSLLVLLCHLLACDKQDVWAGVGSTATPAHEFTQYCIYICILSGSSRKDEGYSMNIRVNPSLEIIPCTEDEILVRRGSRSTFSRVIKDEAQRGLLLTTVKAFRNPVPTTVARESAPTGTDDDFNALVAYLLEQGVLVDETHSNATIFGEISTLDPIAAVAAKRIGLIGLGPIGQAIIKHLADAGAASIIGLDDRYQQNAENSVTNSQAGLHFDIINGALADETAIESLFVESDFVLLAIEAFRPTVLHLVNLSSISYEKPWMPVYADGDEVIVGPFIRPGITPCFNEFEIQHEAARSLRTEYLLYKESLLEAGSPLLSSIAGPIADIAASWASLAVLPYLAGGHSFLEAGTIRIDFERLDVIRERILKIPRCPACDSLRPDYRHPFL